MMRFQQQKQQNDSRQKSLFAKFRTKTDHSHTKKTDHCRKTYVAFEQQFEMQRNEYTCGYTCGERNEELEPQQQQQQPAKKATRSVFKGK